MVKILAINGSYREDGMTDQAVAALAESLEAAGAEAENIFLRKYPLEFCMNCRACTKQPGESPAAGVVFYALQPRS